MGVYSFLYTSGDRKLMYTEAVFSLSALFRDRSHRFFRLIFAGAFLLRILTLLLAFHMRGSLAFLVFQYG